MKSPYSRAAAALLITVGLAGCGGKASFDISGTIVNLRNAGLVLANNGDTVAPVAGASTFSFPNQVSYGESYNVTVQAQPAHMTCGVISGGSGTAGQYTSITVALSCVQNTYAVGGSISGLTVAGLVLANGSTATTLTPAAAATTFAMPDVVADGSFYGVTVQTQPPGLVCAVANGSGTVGTVPVGNIAVTCVPAT
ncbi:hypothetical protein AAKU55_001321 [Oxalobacteraceae bacterium GrIS 1.11]